MSTPYDVEPGPRSRRRGSASSAQGSAFWKWACGGCAAVLLCGCVLVVIAVVMGVNWVGGKLDEFKNYTDGHPVFAKHPNGQSVLHVAFSPDGSRIASLTSNSTSIWNAETGENVLTFDPGMVTSGIITYRTVAFSLDGTRLAIGGQTRLASGPKSTEKVGGATIWDATSGKKLLTLEGHARPVGGIAYSPDGKWLATASGAGDTGVLVWDAVTGKQVLELKGHTEWVMSVAFSPDGSRLVTGSCDGSVRLWNTGSGEMQRNIELAIEMPVGPKDADDVVCTRFSHDGKQVWGTTKTVIRSWDADTGDEIVSSKNPLAFEAPGQVAVHPATKRLATAYDTWVTVRDLTTGDVTHRLNTKPHFTPNISPGRLLCVAFSPDGSRVVGGGFDGAIRVWTLND